MVSDSPHERTSACHFRVLILVVVEYGLGHVSPAAKEALEKGVLILVVVEYGLGRNHQ